MARPKLRLIPGGRKPRDPAATSAALSAYVGTSVHVLRGYADYDDANRDRDILHEAGLDASISLGVGTGILWVLMVPVGDAVEAHLAFEQAARRASDRPALPTHRQPAPDFPSGGVGLELAAGPGDRPRGCHNRGRTYKTRGSALHATLGGYGVKNHYAFASSVLGRELTTLSGLTAEEAAQITRAAVMQQTARRADVTSAEAA